jgi:hypothetical protein
MRKFGLDEIRKRINSGYVVIRTIHPMDMIKTYLSYTDFSPIPHTYLSCTK